MSRARLRNEAASAEALDGAWLKTGDLGFVHDGALYLVGRAKEMIVKGGRNLFPQDLERVAAEVRGVRAGSVAAFGRHNQATGTDDLVLVIESAEPDAEARAGLVREVRGALLAALDTKPDAVHLWPVGSIPRTTSGKLQRNALAQAFEDGEFAAELAEFDRAWAALHGQGRMAKGRVEAQLKAIVDDAMPGKHVDIDDNLFDVGASSLTLIQIHEKIDEAYPGAVELTELFDFPTISTLAQHLESKIGG